VTTRYDVSPLGPGPNWVTKTDPVTGLGPYLHAIAHALMRAGHSESEAVALAVGAVKRWAAGEGHVTAKTRAKAAEAVAHWEALKAASHARADDDEDEQDWLEELAEQEAEMEDADSPGAVIPGNVRFDTRTGPKGYSHGWIKSAS